MQPSLPGPWGPTPWLPQTSLTKRKRKKKRKKKERKTPCSSPSSCRLSGAELSSVLGLSVPLSSAPAGQGTCLQPWVDLFLRGVVLFLVGLGGKEGWGFVQCLLLVLFISLHFFFLLPLFLRLPSLPEPFQSPPQACCVSPVPTLLPHFSFVCVRFCPFLSSFGFPESVEKGGRGGQSGPERGGAGRGLGGLEGLAPPTRRRGLPGAPPREGAQAGRPALLCAAGRRALMGSCWRSRGGGRGRKSKCRYILKTNNLDIASSSLWHPLGAGSREEGEPEA